KSGIREDFDFAKLAINKYGIIRKQGAWFTICDPYTKEVLEDPSGKILKINGMVKVYDFLKNTPEYYQKLRKFILDDINGVESEDNELSEDDSFEDEQGDSIDNVNSDTASVLDDTSLETESV
ncbi:MAG: hypothetical protein NC548_55540, partial [Lachnospiraceae bacterium]|nr:hypothetical protein [Lachnospiraceae bacterium]